LARKKEKMSNKRLWLVMSNKRLWLIRVIVIVGVTAVIAVVKQFSPIAAAATGGILVGGAIAYLLPLFGAQWQKPLWWLAIIVALVVALVLAIIGSMGSWFWALFVASIAIGIAAVEVVMLIRHKK
jgi:O-antigen ligase